MFLFPPLGDLFLRHKWFSLESVYFATSAYKVYILHVGNVSVTQYRDYNIDFEKASVKHRGHLPSRNDCFVCFLGLAIRPRGFVVKMLLKPHKAARI